MNIDENNKDTENETLISALIESEQSYRLLAETASDAIIKIDANSTILFANRACERIFGYAPQQLTGLSLTTIIPEEMRVRHSFGLEKYLVTGNRNISWESVEVPALHKSGRVFPLEISFAESKTEHGHFFIGIGRDISKRKQYEEELFESQMMLSLAMQSSRMGVWEQDVASDLVIWSNELEEIFGLGKGEFKGTRAAYYELVHEDDRERIWREVGEAIEQKRSYLIDFRFYHRDGSIRWMEGRGQAVYSENGAPVRVYGIGIDITERKKAEEDLRESEERYRKLFNSIDEGFCIVEVYFDENDRPFDYKFLQANPAMEHLTGLKDAIGKTARELVPDLEDFWFETYGKVALTGESARFENQSEPMKRWFDVYASRIGGADSRRVAIVFSNITERKRIELEREELLEREKTARLEAEAANRAKDEFLSVLSHELRTPLNSMLGWTRMMKSGLLDETRYTQAVETIERNARLQNNLIEDLLDVSRIISGKMLIEETEVNFVSVINAALEIVQSAADAKNINLEFASATENPKITGDATRLQQIVVNLLNNAIKFTPENGSVKLNLTDADELLTLEVSDTGIGISADFLPHIFDRFRQADSTTRRNHSGLGLGLTIVRHLAELHGGEISATSDGTNSGATFTLRLPHNLKNTDVSPSETEEYSAPPETSADKPLDGKSILLVDDDCEGIMPVQIFLENQGARVHCAEKAKDALEKLIEQEFDLIVSDIGMPEFDGYHLITKIRESEKTVKIPAIALTAYASADDRERALSFGFNHHLAKPVDFDHLLNLILNAVAAPKPE